MAKVMIFHMCKIGRHEDCVGSDPAGCCSCSCHEKTRQRIWLKAATFVAWRMIARSRLDRQENENGGIHEKTL